jgi:hypothetical protein
LLILFGVASLVLGAVVLALNRDIATDLLAAVALVAGAAMILISLPENGNASSPPSH